MKKRLQHYGNSLISGMKEISWLGLLLLGLSPGHILAASAPDFWLAERGSQKLWLLGSIHVGSEEMYPLSPVIMQSWEHAENLIIETDLSNTAENNQTLLNYAMLPSDSTLIRQLNEPLYRKTMDVASQYQLKEPLLAHFRPWFIAITLQQQAIQLAGYQSDLGIDQYFIKQAKSRQLPVTWLETPEQQLAYLAGLGDVEDDFLDATLQQISKVHEELPELIKAWGKGDREKIQTLLDDESTSPELQHYLKQYLLKERNQRWIPKIMSQPSTNNFIVVGAMHLYGRDGLLKLLESNGYRLTHINTQ